MDDDPFRTAREKEGVMRCPFQGERIPMILRHADVRDASKDWKTYSSDAPFRVPIPSEEDVRNVRQLPIETDPPEHTEYRKIVEPFFKRPRDPDFIAAIDSLIGGMVREMITRGETEIVGDFAVPLQSRALAHLLNVGQEEAETWISWGVHVFHDPSKGKASTLDGYIAAQLDRAEKSPGEDFFSALTRAEYQGRKLTRDEMAGFANLTFAGGRDTVIHSISSIIAHLAENPEALAFLREDPRRITLAGEEFLRVISPLTHIGRVCPETTDVHGVNVPPDGRVSLCWASANRDAAAFDSPEEIRLDRKPNPHLAFGAGAHLCLGAAHARLIIRLLLEHLSQRVAEITILSSKPNIERRETYARQIGYESLTVRMGSPCDTLAAC
jgi:cytochrome P450